MKAWWPDQTLLSGHDKVWMKEASSMVAECQPPLLATTTTNTTTQEHSCFKVTPRRVIAPSSSSYPSELQL